MLVVTLIAIAYHPPVSEVSASADSAQVITDTEVTSADATSVDKVVATDIASSLAESTDVPVSNNVANLSQSLAVESVLAQTNTNVISKPQVVQPTASSQRIKKYKTVKGDTVARVAKKFAISEQTLKWANDLTSNSLAVGKKLTILPVDGVLYTAKSGDTVKSIAAKYKASAAEITAYNNLELKGNPSAGTQLVIPGGVLPDDERPGYVAPVTTVNYGYGGGYSGGYGSAYYGNTSAGNRYAWGNCTWYAYERRLQLGHPVGSFWGNANTWAYAARMAGYKVDGTPTAGAVMQNGGGFGHVAIVESVKPGVSVTISEMNGYRFGGGFARVGHGDIPWSEATSGMYQYIH